MFKVTPSVVLKGCLEFLVTRKLCCVVWRKSTSNKLHPSSVNESVLLHFWKNEEGIHQSAHKTVLRGAQVTSLVSTEATESGWMCALRDKKPWGWQSEKFTVTFGDIRKMLISSRLICCYKEMRDLIVLKGYMSNTVSLNNKNWSIKESVRMRAVLTQYFPKEPRLSVH